MVPRTNSTNLIILAKYRHVGCFVDKPQRAIPYSGKTFSGSNAIPQCAAIAASKCNLAFGVQYGGECFTGPRAHLTYDVYGKARDSDCRDGLGGSWRNNIYFLGKFLFFSQLFLLFCTIQLHFHKDGYHSSIVWLSTKQNCFTIRVDITTLFDDLALQHYSDTNDRILH